MPLLNAFEYAEIAHIGQKKSGTEIPLISHPLAVASFVLRYGGTETQAQAALIHDTINDPGITEEEIAEKFGSAVTRYVFAFADPPFPSGATPGWKERRVAYLTKLTALDEDVLFVIACEELHDLSELLHDLRHVGVKTWDRFEAAPVDLYWGYRELLKLFYDRLPKTPGATQLAAEFARCLRELKAVGGPGFG